MRKLLLKFCFWYHMKFRFSFFKFAEILSPLTFWLLPLYRDDFFRLFFDPILG